MRQEPYRQILQMIREDLRDVGGDLQRGATDGEIEGLQKNTQQKLGACLPPAYTDFLRITNGLSWGGIAVFGITESPIVGFPDRYISAFIESNIGFRKASPHFQDFLIFGSDGDSLLSFNISKDRYEVFTVFMAALDSFGTFENMISHALNKQI
jgi:hypothetical protein